MEGRVALAKDKHGHVEVIRILEWGEDEIEVGTFVDSNFKLIPIERSRERKRFISKDEITFFGRPQDLKVENTVACILINNELISIGYVERKDQYPKVANFPIYGSGVRGVNFKRELPIPDQAEIDPGNFYYVKDERVKEFIALLTQRTNQYLWDYMHSHLHNMEQIKLLTIGWKMVFYLDKTESFIDSETEEISCNFIKGIFEDWEKLHRDVSMNVNEIWTGFDNFPNLILPSLTTVIMFFQGYNSLISYDGDSIIYPPYAADIKYLTM